jgi:hypothetical protein
MACGLGMTVAGVALLTANDVRVAVVTGVLLVAAGLIAAAAAVQMRLRAAGDGLDQRVESAGLVAAGAFAALLAFFGLGQWDSGRLFFGALVAVGLVGSVLVLLPVGARRLVLSLLVVLHFGGILTAVTAIPPAGQQAPWLPIQTWMHFYRPYLQSLYLINAYHFYSPEPGPANLLWFCVHYEDGTLRWLKLPNRDESLTPMQYQRLLALTESTNDTKPGLPPSEAEWQMMKPNDPNRPPRSLDSLVYRRKMAGANFDPPIPFPAWPLEMQYREPTPYAKQMLSSYARYVIHSLPHELDPNVRARSVKIYRVTHRLIAPAELAQGISPLDPRYFWAYFQGEFDPDGKLLDPEEPFLYWVLPMANLPRDPHAPAGPEQPTDPARSLDCVKIHGEHTPLERKKPQ